jgi:hypothetical protein
LIDFVEGQKVIKRVLDLQKGQEKLSPPVQNLPATRFSPVVQDKLWVPASSLR